MNATKPLFATCNLPLKKSELIKTIFICFAVFSTICNAIAQDTLFNNSITLREAFELAINNSVKLNIGQKSVELARQQVAVSKLSLLPSISAGLSYGYISNSDIWSPSFSDHRKGYIPGQFTQLTLQAAEVIYSGGEIKNRIIYAALEEQLAASDLEKNSEAIKLLVAAYYLDIYRFLNQRRIFVNNEQLARERLQNVLVMQKQGMVTENDVLRTKLIISDLLLNIRKTDNTIVILNQQLNMVTGLPFESRLIPDSSLINQEIEHASFDSFISKAFLNNHELKIASTENRLEETRLKILKSEKYPELALYAGSSLQRPFLNYIPSIDIFYNVWQAGLSLRYNISSIYQAPRKIKAGQIQLEKSRYLETLEKQQVTIAVSKYYIKYNEARDERKTAKNDLKYAEENYRIVEKKYYNQLSLVADLIDATNVKIEAELKVTNAEINVVYNYCQLLKSVGIL